MYLYYIRTPAYNLHTVTILASGQYTVFVSAKSVQQSMICTYSSKCQSVNQFIQWKYCNKCFINLRVQYNNIRQNYGFVVIISSQISTPMKYYHLVLCSKRIAFHKCHTTSLLIWLLNINESSSLYNQVNIARGVSLRHYSNCVAPESSGFGECSMTRCHPFCWLIFMIVSLKNLVGSKADEGEI